MATIKKCLPTAALALALSFVDLVQADWQFQSRPDLAPPRLNITIPAASDVGKGYLFVAPFAGLIDGPNEQYGPRQAAPYIFRDDGDLVWSGYGYYSIWATNFQAARWNGTDVLFSFEGDHNPGQEHGHGHVTILDQHYETIRELRAGNHKLIDKHEFHIIDEETALVQIYQPVPRNLTEWGASPKQQWIVNAIFQEIDIISGDVVFEWASLDHVTPDEAILPINSGQAGSGYNSSDAWDYFHINSVDKDSSGNYLISARDACAVHKISGQDGTILYRLGGTNSSFHLGVGVPFCFQHHARTFNRTDTTETISLFDNSAHGTESSAGEHVRTNATSAGKIIHLDHVTRQATLVQGFYPPANLSAKSQGSTQILPNGNALVNWGSEGAVTEFRKDGSVMWHLYLDSGDLDLGVQNYRAFRYNWTGLPAEVPAVVSLWHEDTTTIYVSWNGDTETKLWRFYAAASGKAKNRKLLGEATRASFETSLRLEGVKVDWVLVEAVDEAGHVLTTSSLVRSEFEVEHYGYEHHKNHPAAVQSKEGL